MAYRFVSITADDHWAKKVALALNGESANCSVTRSPSEAWNRICAGEADVALLDLDLPAAERLGWFRLLRRSEDGRRFPVVLASRQKSDAELAEAFELNADDYVLKSSDARELLARLRSVLRRRFEKELHFDGVLSAGPVTLDKGRHVCRVRGKAVTLNPREFELLETLLGKAGRVLSRPYLLETVWGMSGSASTRSVDVAVSRLRKALGSRAGSWIETIERYGYRFRDPEDSAR
jgi:DNA-binding response OmpR family regulator